MARTSVWSTMESIRPMAIPKAIIDHFRRARRETVVFRESFMERGTAGTGDSGRTP